MKKLFFFRSSASSSGNNNPVPPSSTDKEVYWENPLGNGLNNQASDKVENSFRSPKGLFSKARKQVSERQSSGSGLRRSRSLSSAAFHVGGPGQRNFSCLSDQSRSPSSSTSSVLPQRPDRSSRRRALTPERHPNTKRFEVAGIRNAQEIERPGSAGSYRSHNDLSGSSSFSSSNVSNKIVDRYIDGEEQQERSMPNNSSSQINHTGNGNGAGRRPPRVQYTAPTSPMDGVKEKPRSHSFREGGGTRLQFSNRDWTEHGFGHESPRRLAKNVIERLSQCQVLPKTCSKGFDPDIPITIEDIYGGSLNGCSSSNSDGVAQKSCQLHGPYETTNGCYGEDFSGLRKQNCFPGDNCGGLYPVETEEDVDVEIRRKLQEAEERVMFLSEELEQESFLRDSGFDVPGLIQTIRNLNEERISLALEVSGLLQCRISERASAKEELRLVRSELDLQTRRLKKEKNELQSGLEKELDRRSNDWSFKLEKYQLEEHRLRERGLTTRVEESAEENRDLRQNLSELQEKYRAAEEDRDCIRSNYEEKEKECKELRKSITRLLRTCTEQEKTIDGLREGLGEEVGKKQSLEKFDKHVGKLQMEHMRLTGVEQTLRREVESYRLEVDSLRHENINLLNRLKGNVKVDGSLSFKLDQELWTRICCLQNQGLSLLNESTCLCSKLLEFIKGKGSHIPDSKQGIEVIKSGLDGQFVVESDMKVQGFKRGTESLARSLKTMSALLQEKSNPSSLESQAQCTEDDGSEQLNVQSSKDTLRSELKAETLLTTLLREKLYSKELEVEQLQAELATAVRGNDILRCEVQNALDNLSVATHKLKDLELQMLKKDENISQIQSNLQESTKELTIIRGILPKVSEERDFMWEEVKQYSEKNMLLNSQINVLKKKIDALDEDILLKEGQITILKDTLGKQPFDLLLE
ncbi:hypothetical protein L1049_011323 [Liquidambar formosana]|uniref:DUF7653 domain-containing protein n=1 Tax=Liquidambar formosana TaxID=63359 RepID=A0AAP0RRZ6_LIQFO